MLVFFYAYTSLSARCFFKNKDGDLPEVCYILEYWKIPSVSLDSCLESNGKEKLGLFQEGVGGQKSKRGKGRCKEVWHSWPEEVKKLYWLCTFCPEKRYIY